MSGTPYLVPLLVVVITALVSIICGITAGLLKRLDGGSVPASLMMAGGAVGACVTVGLMAMGLMWGR